MGFVFGGEGGILTLAPIARPTPLAGAPLQPLEYFSKCLNIYFYLHGGEGGIRTHGPLAGITGFQDRLLKPLGHLSKVALHDNMNFSI